MWTIMKTAQTVPSVPSANQTGWRWWPVVAGLMAGVYGSAVSAAESTPAHAAAHESAQPGQPGQDVAAIRQVMMATWDRPEARLSVEPVVVRGPYAVASWAQGERGGRAFLSRHGHGPWQVVLCAGDGIRSAAALRDMGLSAADADSMATQWAAEEAALPAAQRAKFSSFEGVVRMDEHGHHPPAAASGAQQGAGHHQHHAH